MKLYLSGPISNNPGFKTAFMEAETALRGVGYEVVNPLKLDHTGAAEHGDFMRADIRALCSPDVGGLALLPLTRHSRGTITELMVAESIGIPALIVEQWVKASGKGEV